MSFRLGVVVGKFAPLHKGHVLLIERALAACERVALLSYSNPELPGYEPARREGWLRTLFPDAAVLVVTPEALCSWLGSTHVPAIPANDAPDSAQRDFVALLCRRVLGSRPDAVFSSEEYGAGFAAHLTRCLDDVARDAPAIRHVMVDRERRSIPISGTQLRNNLWRHWQYLPPAVARSLVQRVAILGGESSGKTVLAARLAQELESAWAPEYGRELWVAKRGELAREDMLRIPERQIEREESAARDARAFVFCDTTPLTTLFYSREMLDFVDPQLALAARRSYARTVLCAPDFPFVQDGTRRDDAFRQRQHAWYERELAARGARHVLAGGALGERCRLVRQHLGV